MATSYPGSLDSWSNPTSTTTMDDASFQHDVLHSNHNDAVEAIEGELGTDPAGGFPTVRGRLLGVPAMAAYRDAREMLVGPDYMACADYSSSVTMASQEAVYQRWHCPESFTATKLWWIQSSLAATVTGAEIGIYSAAGTKLQSVSIASAVTSEGLKSATITGQSLSAGTVYYLAWVVNASTAGAIGGHFIFSSAAAVLGASASDRIAYIQTGQTALPASTTFSGLSVKNYAFALGVSAS